MNKFYRIVAFFLLISFVSCTSAPYTTTQQSQQTQVAAQTAFPAPYWTGDGGRGRSITILPPKGFGLTENQAILLDAVAVDLMNNFSSFSAMTVFDRVNNQRQYDELLSGYYADDDKAGLDLGHLASTDFMLLGNITKTSTSYVLQLTVNRNSDKTIAATYSGTVSITELENLSGVRRASLDLLQKMGVQLTAQARTELTSVPTTDQLNSRNLTAQGINAQQQGTVDALTYFYQAEAYDPSLTEAVSGINVVSANISTGNIGADVRNDFAWSDAWESKLRETETLMNDMLRNTSPQRSIWYSDNVLEVESARDRERRTTELRIDAVLHTYAVFPVSVQRTVQAVYDGLQTTKRAQAWRLDGWPRQGVTNNNPFNRTWGSMIPIAFEVLNGQGQVIGRQTVEMDSRFSFSGTRLEGPGTAFATVRFTGVRADDIQYPLSIRIASINGRLPEAAGISQVAPISAGQMQASRSFTIYNGTIRPSSNNRDLGAVTIPAELWGERVTAIANGAYERSGLTSVTIPEGVTTIGDRAFADNHWTTYERQSNGIYDNSHYGLTKVTIPSSVTSVGQEAFASHWTTYHSSQSGGYTSDHWLVTEVTIGANVKLGNNAIGNGFEAFYANSGRQAGVYRYGIYGIGASRWERFDNKEILEQRLASDRKTWNGIAYTFAGLLGAGFITWAIVNPESFRRAMSK